MASQRQFEPVCSLFLSAAVGGTEWGKALDALSEAVGGSGVALVPIHGRSAISPCSESLVEAHAAYVREGWIEHDVRYRGVPRMLRAGVATELDFIGPDDLIRHPYWMEWLGRFGLRWFAGLKVDFGGDLWCLSIQRSIAQGPFLPEETQAMVRLAPHLSAAGAFARALGFARLEAAVAAFDISGTAVLFLDRHAHVIRANSAAEVLLGPDLQINSGRLISYDHEATSAWERTLAALLCKPLVDVPALAVFPRRERKPLVVYVSRAEHELADAFGPCSFVATIVDVGSAMTPDERALEKALRLTRAQARLAVLLGKGMTVREASTSLGTSYETTRKTLQTIYEKVGVKRQAELTMILAQLKQR